MCVSERKICQFFEKVCPRTKWMIPIQCFQKTQHSYEWSFTYIINCFDIYSTLDRKSYNWIKLTRGRHLFPRIMVSTYLFQGSNAQIMNLLLIYDSFSCKTEIYRNTFRQSIRAHLTCVCIFWRQSSPEIVALWWRRKQHSNYNQIIQLNIKQNSTKFITCPSV